MRHQRDVDELFLVHRQPIAADIAEVRNRITGTTKRWNFFGPKPGPSPFVPRASVSEQVAASKVIEATPHSIQALSVRLDSLLASRGSQAAMDVRLEGGSAPYRWILHRTQKRWRGSSRKPYRGLGKEGLAVTTPLVAKR